MQKTGKTPQLCLLLFAIMLLFCSVSSAATTATFYSHFGNSYNLATQLNLLPALSATALGNTLSNGSLVCSGIPLVLAESNASTFTPTSASVECPYNCQIDTSSPLSIFPQSLAWLSSTDFSSNQTFYSTKLSWCRSYYQVQPANPLTPYVMNAAYTTLVSSSGNGRADVGVLCEGNLSFIDGSTQIGSPYTPASIGSHLISANLTTDQCAAVARSYETNGAMLDCWYSSTATNNMSALDSLNVTITNGPNFTIISNVSPFIVAPGGSFNISLPINNVAAMNGTITNVTIDQGFNITNFNPITIDAGQTGYLNLTITAPNGSGNYTPNLNLTYTSDTFAVGSCGSGNEILSISGIVSCPTTTLVSTCSPNTFTVAAGSSITVGIPIQNTGAFNATITSVIIDQGLAVTGFSLVEVDAGQAVDLELNISVPYTITKYVPTNTTITISYVSNTTLSGCGNIVNTLSASCLTFNIIPPSPISPVIFANPSGILEEGGPHPIWYPSSQVMLTANITRGPMPLLASTISNITVYMLDSTGKQLVRIVKFCSQPGGDETCMPLYVTSNYTIGGALNYESISQPLGISLLAPSVYSVVLSTYDPLRQETMQSGAFFVIYELTCSEKA